MTSSCVPVIQTPEREAVDPARCPLCGGPNDCQLCTAAAYKGPCWCESAKIPDELLVLVPTEARNRACICRSCVTTFHRAQTGAVSCSRRREEADPRGNNGEAPPPPHVGGYAEASRRSTAVLPGDSYFDQDGLMVFTAAYHRRRGYCCDNDCRHCPYEEGK